MAFFLAIVGIVLIVAAVRGQTDALFSLVKSDFTGKDNFIYWMAAILIIGALGYIPKIKPISVALLSLVIVVLFLKNGGTTGTAGGFFANLASGLASTQTASPSSSAAASSAGSSSNPITGLLNLPALPSISKMVQ